MLCMIACTCARLRCHLNVISSHCRCRCNCCGLPRLHAAHQVVVNTTTGLYAVYNGDTKWFDSDPATAQAVHVQGAWYGRTTGGPIANLLHAAGTPTTASGTDGALGDFQEISFLWTAGSTPCVVAIVPPPPPTCGLTCTRLRCSFNTSIRVYTSADNILFRQHFPAGASGTSLGSQTEPVSAFPSFQSSGDTLLAQLRYLTWEVRPVAIGCCAARRQLILAVSLLAAVVCSTCGTREPLALSELACLDTRALVFPWCSWTQPSARLSCRRLTASKSRC